MKQFNHTVKWKIGIYMAGWILIAGRNNIFTPWWYYISIKTTVLITSLGKFVTLCCSPAIKSEYLSNSLSVMTELFKFYFQEDDVLLQLCILTLKSSSINQNIHLILFTYCLYCWSIIAACMPKPNWASHALCSCLFDVKVYEHINRL